MILNDNVNMPTPSASIMKHENDILLMVDGISLSAVDNIIACPHIGVSLPTIGIEVMPVSSAPKDEIVNLCINLKYLDSATLVVIHEIVGRTFPIRVMNRQFT